MTPPYVPQLRRYQAWLRDRHGLAFASYEELWRWSVGEQGLFWQSIWDHDEIRSPTPHSAVLAGESMPGAVWFPGARVNYAHQVLRHVDAAHAAGCAAIVAEDERGHVTELGWPELRRQVASFAAALREMGMGHGDRVVACMPNVAETIVAFLGCCSVGAIWSVCAPDMGARAILDRFRQVEPALFIAADAVLYGGRTVSRAEAIATIRQGLPTLRTVVVHRSGHAAAPVACDREFADMTATPAAALADFRPDWVPFDHPLWIVYTSGTTGMPKPIVHGHGGVILAAAAGAKNIDLGSSYDPNSAGERYHWYSTCSWIMWNAQVAGLLNGTTICVYDGSPSGAREAPDYATLWRFAARHRVTFFGSGAAFYEGCRRAGLDIADAGDISAIRAIGTTGSPLSEATFRWGIDAFARVCGREIWWVNISGGTDIAANFVSGNRELPQVAGRMQCRQLGTAAAAWDENGQEVVGAMGDLVCTRPLPSMPLRFWGDTDGRRYLDSYFREFPGTWRHGDWISIAADGSCVIYGRSDATLNRAGLRLGTSEIYDAIEALPEIADALVIDLEYLGRESHMELFVTLAGDLALTPALEGAIRQAIRTSVSPRFVPDRITQAPSIPRTLTGKKMEVPIKRLFLGQDPARVLNRATVMAPDSLDWFVAAAARHLAGRPAPLPDHSAGP